MLKYRSGLPKPVASISRAILLKTMNDIPFRAFQQCLDAVFAPKLNELHHLFVAPSIHHVSPWPRRSIDTASIDVHKTRKSIYTLKYSRMCEVRKSAYAHTSRSVLYIIYIYRTVMLSLASRLHIMLALL